MNSPVLNIQADDICIAWTLKACNSSMPEINPFLIRQPNSSRSHASRYKSRVLAGAVFASRAGDVPRSVSLPRCEHLDVPPQNELFFLVSPLYRPSHPIRIVDVISPHLPDWLCPKRRVYSNLQPFSIFPISFSWCG